MGRGLERAFTLCPSQTTMPPANKRELNDVFGTNEERGKPVSFLARAAQAVRLTVKVRVWELGKSECRVVMARIREHSRRESEQTSEGNSS